MKIVHDKMQISLTLMRPFETIFMCFVFKVMHGYNVFSMRGGDL